MPARTPEECDRLFGEHVKAGELNELMALYEEGGRLVQHDGRVARGHQAIRQVLGRRLAIRPKLRMDVVKVVTDGEGLAVVYNDWSMSATGADGRPIDRGGKAIEVVRRQPDGTWRFVIDEPYGRG